MLGKKYDTMHNLLKLLKHKLLGVSKNIPVTEDFSTRNNSNLPQDVKIQPSPYYPAIIEIMRNQNII